MDKNSFCVIMAGGVGSRFWPLSRNSMPKQFLDIMGTGRTLLQMTFDRFSSQFPVENIFIVTNYIYKDLIISQLPKIIPDHILLEPVKRNTAPCIAYASFKIWKINPDANIVVSPSDHIILKEDDFKYVISQGIGFVSSHDSLLTLGIKPDRPETGYGYIQMSHNAEPNICKVKTFTEKPDYNMAQFFYESGEFFWNSGIFIWKLSSIIQAFKKYLPEVHSLFHDGLDIYNTPDEEKYISKIYSECKNISIDYGIMEKADNVYVICSDFGWSDLGTWGSLYEHLNKDKEGNVKKGEGVFVYDSKNCIINMPDDKLVILQGLDDYIVVESNSILLICRKKDEQQIRQFVNDVKLKKGDKYI